LGNHGGLTNRTTKSDLTKNGEDEYGGHFLIRPGAREFLERLEKYYELVIFTAALQDYADWVLDILDQQKTIKYRIYRQHAVREGPVFVKDLNNLGRSIDKMIIVDNVA
jgi:TFIIF-interacting CTD phosphatase-like protein